VKRLVFLAGASRVYLLPGNVEGSFPGWISGSACRITNLHT